MTANVDVGEMRRTSGIIYSMTVNEADRETLCERSKQEQIDLP